MLVSPCCCGVTCFPCTIPKKNLTLTATGSFGTLTATMVYDGASTWTTGCVNNVVFALQCVGGVVTFSGNYFISGVCPTGGRRSCASNGGGGALLTQTQATCSPLLLRYSVTNAGCPQINSLGFTTLTVTE
jgi:hypothetical protein